MAPSTTLRGAQSLDDIGANTPGNTAQTSSSGLLGAEGPIGELRDVI